MSAPLRLVEPRNENRSVPIRPANAELRSREYLTEAEVEKLIKAARNGRHGHRDATLILIAFRHGLRAVELCDLEWSQVEFGRSASLHVRRAKNGKPSVHPLRGDEIRALRELKRQFPDSGFVFATERSGPFTTDAVNRLVKRIGERAGLPFPIHVHMLRHACGYALANAGHDTRALQDWLGHRSIQHTVRYTELAPTRFKDFRLSAIAPSLPLKRVATPALSPNPVRAYAAVRASRRSSDASSSTSPQRASKASTTAMTPTAM